MKKGLGDQIEESLNSMQTSRTLIWIVGPTPRARRIVFERLGRELDRMDFGTKTVVILESHWSQKILNRERRSIRQKENEIRVRKRKQYLLDECKGWQVKKNEDSSLLIPVIYLVNGIDEEVVTEIHSEGIMSTTHIEQIESYRAKMRFQRIARMIVDPLGPKVIVIGSSRDPIMLGINPHWFIRDGKQKEEWDQEERYENELKGFTRIQLDLEERWDVWKIILSKTNFGKSVLKKNIETLLMQIEPILNERSKISMESIPTQPISPRIYFLEAKLLDQSRIRSWIERIFPVLERREISSTSNPEQNQTQSIKKGIKVICILSLLCQDPILEKEIAVQTGT